MNKRTGTTKRTARATVAVLVRAGEDFSVFAVYRGRVSYERVGTAGPIIGWSAKESLLTEIDRVRVRGWAFASAVVHHAIERAYETADAPAVWRNPAPHPYGCGLPTTVAQ